MRWLRLLPALIPSWRFFDAIGPSPRVEYRLLSIAGSPLGEWRPFCPRPSHLTVGQMMLRLGWNPAWNEALYVMRCAERVLEGDTGFPLFELERRLRRALRQAAAHAHSASAAAMFEMRILAATRKGHRITHQPVYRSAVLALTEVGDG